MLAIVNMKFLFSCSTRQLTRSLRLLESYRVKHSNRNSISKRAHVLFYVVHYYYYHYYYQRSMFVCRPLGFQMMDNES